MERGEGVATRAYHGFSQQKVVGSTGHAAPTGAPPSGSQEPGTSSSTKVDFMLTTGMPGSWPPEPQASPSLVVR
jgi:hypothetical protein